MDNMIICKLQGKLETHFHDLHRWREIVVVKVTQNFCNQIICLCKRKQYPRYINFIHAFCNIPKTNIVLFGSNRKSCTNTVSEYLCLESKHSQTISR